MRFLFVRDCFRWPRSSGHDVHGFYMLRSLAEMGHWVGVATRDELVPEAMADAPISGHWLFSDATVDSTKQLSLPWRQERFRRYWGAEKSDILAVAHIARETQCDVVVAVGIRELTYLTKVDSATRVWYAADEGVRHELSLLRRDLRRIGGHLWAAAVRGLCERSFAPSVDRTWVVTQDEAHAMRWFGGMSHVDVVPNGVDCEHFRPRNRISTEQETCVFWGRLDFGPNIHAVRWFVRKVWPLIIKTQPNAKFKIYGFKPSEEVTRLSNTLGVQLIPDLPDIRHEIQRCQVVVLPFVSGGGIKNKLLEAAALSMPIVASRRAIGGLSHSGELPILVAGTPQEWANQLNELWKRPAEAQTLGTRIRDWVKAHHSWPSAAKLALEGLSGDTK